MAARHPTPHSAQGEQQQTAVQSAEKDGRPPVSFFFSMGRAAEDGSAERSKGRPRASSLLLQHGEGSKGQPRASPLLTRHGAANRGRPHASPLLIHHRADSRGRQCRAQKRTAARQLASSSSAWGGQQRTAAQSAAKDGRAPVSFFFSMGRAA